MAGTLISSGDPFLDSQVDWEFYARTQTQFSIILREIAPEVKNVKISWMAICRDTGTNVLETF